MADMVDNCVGDNDSAGHGECLAGWSDRSQPDSECRSGAGNSGRNAPQPVSVVAQLSLAKDGLESLAEMAESLPSGKVSVYGGSRAGPNGAEGDVESGVGHRSVDEATNAPLSGGIADALHHSR